MHGNLNVKLVFFAINIIVPSRKNVQQLAI